MKQAVAQKADLVLAVVVTETAKPHLRSTAKVGSPGVKAKSFTLLRRSDDGYVGSVQEGSTTRVSTLAP